MSHTAEEGAVRQVSPQWLTLLVGPLTWSFYFLLVYTLGEFGCRGGWLQTTVLGLPAPGLVVSVITVVALVVGGAATRRVYGQWRAASRRQQENWPETEDRDRFMRLAGWMLGLLFTYMILLTGISALVVPQCV
jgi:hypothetical protein